MSGTTRARFVLHCHTGHGPRHWDLMLEDGDVLATWRLGHSPLEADRGPIPAVRIADHRKAYLTYEGPTSGNRGQVVRHDSGTYRTLDRCPDEWTFDLQGRQLSGEFSLRRVTSLPGREPVWELRRREGRRRESRDEFGGSGIQAE